ncbi:hypothetical protein [Bernardetia sp.]|uniref:hypothetical protein n=1 Tax=Bernardetia sp. TaxID=1937974 RepID=UPI0025B9DAC2|nr:hypothetical protein [Bernardetia sp.]
MKNINLHSLSFIVLLTFSTGLLFSCGEKNKNQTSESTSNDSISTETTKETVETINPTEEYRTFVATLDTTQMSSSKEAAEKFQELYSNATPEQADEGFLVFNNLYNSLLINLGEQHFQDTEKTGDYEKYYSIAGIYNGYNDGKDASPEMLAYNKELASHGFGIGMEEGSTYFLQNRDFLKGYFYDRVSPAMKEYLVQKNKEAKEVFASDGGLIISPTRLAERVVWAEKFMKENPNFHPSLNEVIELDKKMYFNALVFGMDNTPLFDYQTKEIDPEFEKAYQIVTSSYSDTETAAIIKPYYEAIKNNNKAKQQEIIEKLRKEGEIYNY